MKIVQWHQHSKKLMNQGINNVETMVRVEMYLGVPTPTMVHIA
jgi:hypothetical protein